MSLTESPLARLTARCADGPEQAAVAPALAAAFRAGGLPWPDDAACGRCGGTGLIEWAGRYGPRDGRQKGPCIRCRKADFVEATGDTFTATGLRLRGL